MGGSDLYGAILVSLDDARLLDKADPGDNGDIAPSLVPALRLPSMSMLACDFFLSPDSSPSLSADPDSLVKSLTSSSRCSLSLLVKRF